MEIQTQHEALNMKQTCLVDFRNHVLENNFVRQTETET